MTGVQTCALPIYFIIIPYHFTIPPASQNSIFIKILFFNLSLLFLSNHHFFSYFGMIQFSWAFQHYFFSSLSPSTSSTGSTHRATHTQRPMIHQLTYLNPSLHTESHTHTQTQTINKATHINTNYQTINRATHTQTIKPVGANNSHHTHHPSHRLANPSHRSETHAADLKPSRFETHRSKPIKKKSSPEPPSELPMINQTDPPTDQQIHRFKPTINQSQPTIQTQLANPQ